MPAVIINKPYKPVIPDNHKICSIHSDYGRYMSEAVEELAGLGCRSVLLVIDPERTDSNRCIHTEFCRLSERYSADGISFSSIPNSMDVEKTRAQISNAFNSGNRWDGVIANGGWLARLYIEEAMKAGSVPGRDFHIIFDDVLDLYDPTGLARCAFIQQPELCGAEAWGVMTDILSGRNKSAELVFPYLRVETKGSESLASTFQKTIFWPGLMPFDKARNTEKN